jgi:ATP-binding cassette subfamily F protein 3
VENGSVAPFDGDLEQYRRMVLRGDRSRSGNGADKPETQVSKAEARRAAADKRAELAPLRQKITAAEKAINAHKAEIERLEAVLAKGLFAQDVQKATSVSKARADAAAALARAEEEWLEASAALEAVTA